MMAKKNESNQKYIKHTLEPIAEVGTGDIQSFEVLSFSADRVVLGITHDENADHASTVYVLMRQLEFFQKLNEYDNKLYRAMFINVAPQVFNEPVSWGKFIPFIFKFRVHIGFDMASVIGGISTEAMYAMSRLKALGVKFWLCNADGSLDRLPTNLLGCFDGMKVSKHCFWQSFSRQDTTLIKYSSAIWGNKNVIVEGVENQHHRIFLKTFGFIQGQGFYFRAKLARNFSWH